MTKTSFRLRNALTSVFAPDKLRCMLCGADVFDGLGFCSACKSSVVYNNGKTCLRCGVGIDGAEDYCNNCAFDKVYFDRAYSVFSYEGAVRQAILQMKFANRGSYAAIFAKYLVFIAQKHNLQYDIVTFAPMSAKTLRKRRYNQAQLLAQHFCDILNQYDMLRQAVIKIKETSPQEKLTKTERKTNLVGAYKINADVKGKRVLVIDDIKTTGATLNECAKVLKRAGAIEVTGITVASRKENALYEQNDADNYAVMPKRRIKPRK